MPRSSALGTPAYKYVLFVIHLLPCHEQQPVATQGLDGVNQGPPVALKMIDGSPAAALPVLPSSSCCVACRQMTSVCPCPCPCQRVNFHENETGLSHNAVDDVITLPTKKVETGAVILHKQ